MMMVLVIHLMYYSISMVYEYRYFVRIMRKKSKKHEKVNEDLQNLLSYIGELIDEGHDCPSDAYSELYEWLEDIMVVHNEIISN